MDLDKVLDEKLKVGPAEKTDARTKKKEEFKDQVKISVEEMIKSGTLKFLPGRKYRMLVKESKEAPEEEVAEEVEEVNRQSRTIFLLVGTNNEPTH